MAVCSDPPIDDERVLGATDSTGVSNAFGPLYLGAAICIPDPAEIVSPTPPPYLSNLDQRVRLIEQQAMDELCIVHFDEQVKNMSAEEFMDRLLASAARTAGWQDRRPVSFARSGVGPRRMFSSLCLLVTPVVRRHLALAPQARLPVGIALGHDVDVITQFAERDLQVVARHVERDCIGDRAARFFG